MWNFNMDEAPKGEYETVTRELKGKDVSYKRYVPVYIFAAGNNLVVTPSRWLPEEGRWSMFTKGVPPIAWHPWPEHPLLNKEEK